MKLSLVVSQGVHNGKVIPIAGTKFSIGRDPSCQLRPASPAVSKTHCTITVENGAVFIVDDGSTNGTIVNGTKIEQKTELNNGDNLKVGPLEFNLNVVIPETVPAQEVLVKAAAVVAEPVKTPARMAPTLHGDDPDLLAAMLLAEDDVSTETIEAHAMDSTTVMEIPALGANPTTKKTEPKKEEQKSAPNAAAEALSMYIRGSRPGQQKPPAGGKK